MPDNVDKEWTCGKGLAANAELPSRMAAVMAALADVLEHHMTALPREDQHAELERRAYENVAARATNAAAALRQLAADMAGYHDLPMAPHDMSVLSSPAARDVFALLVEHEGHLADLLARRRTEHRELLDQM